MKQKIAIKLILLLAVFSFQFSFAQEKKTVSGIVTSGGQPVPGVDVVISGTQEGTSTDDNGSYSLSVSPGDVLEFSYIGLKSDSKVIGASNVLNVSLIEDDSTLDEIVILGYGQKKNKNEVTGNVVTVSGDVINKAPMVSADQALQGKVAGLQMSTSSGSPGATQQIRIRGLNSVSGGNDPLIVIDGVPMVNSNTAGSSDASSLSPLSSINSADIESITVLKDAGATSVYGARGGNGVILITTKSGKSGKTQFNFNTSLGFQNNAVKGAKPLTGAQKKELWMEAYYNSNGEAGSFTKDQAYNVYAAGNPNSALVRWVNEGEKEYNWSDLLSNKNAMIQIYDFSATGGDEKSNFYASLGYNKTESTVIGSDFRRVNATFNFNRELTDKVDYRFSVNVSNTKQDGILEQGAFFSNPNTIKYLMSPWNNPFNADGSYNTNLSGLHNPMYTLSNNDLINDLTRIINSNGITYEIFEDFKFNTLFSIDYQLNNYRNYNNPVHGDGDGVGGYAENSHSSNFNYVSQNSLDYRFFLGDHRFDAKVLMEFQKNKNNYLYAYGENIPTGFKYLGNATANYSGNYELYDWMNLSYLGILNYSYNNKYLVDLSIRREGTSRFSEDNRWGTFWSAGAAWNISQEEFMADNETFSTLRLRGSYGTTGNSSVPVNVYQTMLSTNRYNNAGAFVPTQIGSDIGWETQKKLDFGLDFGLFNQRINGSVAYYQSQSEDLLYALPMSITSGFTSKWINYGDLKNKGIELELNANIIDTENFSWGVSGNYATVKNEMTSLPNKVNGEPGKVETSTVSLEVGHPINEWHMRTYAGVDSQDGSAMWYVNGVDGETTKVYNEAKVAYQGKSAMPTYTGGLGTNIKVKNFFLDANFYFSGGNKVYQDWSNYVAGTTSVALNTYNGTDIILDRWQQPGDQTNTPKLTTASNNNHSISSRFLKDGDFVRLRDVTFGYNFDAKLLQSLAIDGLTLSVRGTNLYTWAKDKSLKFDPEISSGYTNFTSPPVKSVIFSVNVKF